MSNRNMITLKNAMIGILFLIAFLLSRSVFALEIDYVHAVPMGREDLAVEYLLLEGEIIPGDYDHLLNFIYNNPNPKWFSMGRFIHIASPGGDIQEAMKIARFVKSVYARVAVSHLTGKCVSACFFIFASASFRVADPGTIGIHRPYVHPRRLASLSPSQAEAFQNDLFRQARLYLQELQIPTGIIDTMFQRASSEVYWLSDAEFLEQIGINPPWYEQFLIGRCGLDKSLQQKAILIGDISLRTAAMLHVGEVSKCADRLTEQDARSFLWGEFVNAGKNPKEALEVLSQIAPPRSR